MFSIHRSFSLHNKIEKAAILSALLSFLLLGAAFGLAPRPTHAQAANFPLFSPVATTTGLNLREQPSVDGATVATLPVNARAIVMGGPFNDVWYWLDYNGLRGYAS